MSTIIIKNNSTASAVPLTTDLVAGEMAINTADGKLYIKDSSNNVIVVGQNFTSPAVPSTASSTGTAGDIAWDASYFYVCVATNTWVRAGLSTW